MGLTETLTSYTWDMLKYSTLPFMIWMDSSISFILSGHRLSNDQDDLDICWTCQSAYSKVSQPLINISKILNEYVQGHNLQSWWCHPTNILFRNEFKLLMAFYFVC